MAAKKGKEKDKGKSAANPGADDALKGLGGLVDDAPASTQAAQAADGAAQQMQVDPNAPSMAIVAQYVKDLSLENPKAADPPKTEGGRPPIEVNLNVNINKLEGDDYEVALELKVESKVEDATLFLAELSYAGLFRIRNIPEDQLQPILQVEAPRQLFPFARHILSEVTGYSGIAPVLLDPINFAAIYQQVLQQQQAQQNGGAQDAKQS